MNPDPSLDAHSAADRLIQSLWQALQADGKDPDHLHPDDLAAVDQFHIRGKQASVELADLLHQHGVVPQPRILDLGAGLGGSARYLASRFTGTVVGLELSAEYVAAARAFTDRLGQAQQIHFCVGDATAIPYAEQSFDAVWLQHVSMCIADKERLFAEVFRVLKPGASLVLQEIVAGEGGAAHFPVPWAHTAEDSYLSTPSDLLQQLQQQGFRVRDYQDKTPEALQWFQRRSRSTPAAPKSPAALGLKLLLGDGFAVMMANQLRNLTEQRIGLSQLLAQRPADTEAPS
ncbi:MAG: class I SAM-dependent methyltransferase [Motiliproteus sp.]